MAIKLYRLFLKEDIFLDGHSFFLHRKYLLVFHLWLKISINLLDYILTLFILICCT